MPLILSPSKYFRMILRRPNEHFQFLSAIIMLYKYLSNHSVRMGTRWTLLNHTYIWRKQLLHWYLQNNICYFITSIWPWSHAHLKSLFLLFIIGIVYIFIVQKAASLKSFLWRKCKGLVGGLVCHLSPRRQLVMSFQRKQVKKSSIGNKYWHCFFFRIQNNCLSVNWRCEWMERLNQESWWSENMAMMRIPLNVVGFTLHPGRHRRICVWVGLPDRYIQPLLLELWRHLKCIYAWEKF